MVLSGLVHGGNVHPYARVAELADALASGASALTGVGVQVPSRAPLIKN